MDGARKHFDRASPSADSDTAMPSKGSGTEEREGRTPFDRPPLADGLRPGRIPQVPSVRKVVSGQSDAIFAPRNRLADGGRESGNPA
jgi:hypothetical protein